jgi:DinB superfamily
MTEPWLRGTLTELDAVRRQVLHALELAREDVEHWCDGLTDAQMNARPCGVAPVAFHLRHIGRSLDRLLTYADGQQLSEAQLAALQGELEPTPHPLAECVAMIADAMARVKTLSPSSYEEVRSVGRKHLPTTVGGLLIHCAEHTQRHVGQAITTAKVVVALDQS